MTDAPVVSRFSWLLTSPKYLFVGIAASLLVFELLHRVVRLPEILSSVLLSLAFAPLLLWGVMSNVSAVLSDPDGLAHAVLDACAFLLLTVVFFAVLYTELGILEGGIGGQEIRSFWNCLYFSAATLTTLGYGDFAPTPEARVAAAAEAVSGYVLLGMITAVMFFLISHRASKRRARSAGPGTEPPSNTGLR